MTRFNVLLASAAVLVSVAAVSNHASAAPITGSFSLLSFSGTYVSGPNGTVAATATTATGLDFGLALSPTGSGNGFGTNGTAFVGNTTGSFVGLTGATASIADISLGAGGIANPYTANPFVSFGSSSALALNFTNATYTAQGTSITVTGSATFTDGIPADTATGTFSLSTNTQTGTSSGVSFTFTSNASVNAVPEPMSLSLLGMSLAGLGLVRLRRTATA